MNQQQEQEFVYRLLNDLSGVTSPAEYLDIVSQYARAQGACGGTLVWIDNASGDTPTWQEVAARWLDEGQPAPKYPDIGKRVPLDHFWEASGAWFENPTHPTVIEEMATSQLIDECTRNDFYLAAGIHALAFLPLRSGGRWVSALMFRWAEAHEFSPQDRKVFELIMKHAAPVINAVRLLQENRKRAQREELIGVINAALSQAQSDRELLEALQRFSNRHQADALMILWIDVDAQSNPASAHFTSLVGESRVRDLMGQRFPISGAFQSFLKATIDPTTGFDAPTFFEDFTSDHRLEDRAREIVRSWGFKTGVMLPLRSAGQWQALIGVNWTEQHSFSDEEAEVYHRILPTLSSILASRRAYAATQEASQESALLYQLAKSINAATTYQEITDAVAAIYQDCDVIQIQLWENFDYVTATYMDVAAATVNRPSIPAMNESRFPKEYVRLLEHVLIDDQIIIENAHTDERLSDELHEVYKSINLGAFMSAMLRRSDRIVGSISFYYSAPRPFSARDRRLLTGFVEMMLAAVERIQAQIESEAARRTTEENREEAEFLYRLAESFNSAMSYEQVVVLVAELQKDFDSVFLAVPDSFDAYASELYMTQLSSEGSGEYYLSSHTMPLSAFPIVDALRGRRLWAIEDVETDPSVDAISRSSFTDLLDMRAFLGVSFNPEDSNDYLGGFGFRYAQSRTFSDAERRRMAGIGDLVQAAVQRIHSLDESEDARQRSERDREEASLLYRLAQEINAATSYQEIADAVVRIAQDVEGVYITLWDYLDYDRANQYQIVAGAVRGAVLTTDADDAAPISKAALKSYYDQVKQQPRPWCIEDINHDPRADGAVRETYKRIRVRATMVVTLQQGSRWLGSLSFRYSKPRKFDARAKRVALGIGELVQAAVERIRSQLETEAARKRAEIMASVTVALAQARDENEILDALAILPCLPKGSYSSVHYAVFGKDGQLAGFQMQATNLPDGSYAPRDAWMDVVFRVEDFPTLRILAKEPSDIIYLENYLTDSRNEYQETLEHAHSYGWLSVIAIPLWSSGRWHGNIQFGWREPNTFSEELRALLQALMPVLTSVVSARRSYLAEEQARLETEQRVNDLTTVAQVSAAAVSLFDESRLLNEFARLTTERFAPNGVRLYLLDERDTLHRTALDDASQEEAISLFADTLVASAARERKGIIHTQTRDEHLVSTVHDGKVSVAALSSELAVPMVVRERLIGVLNVQAPTGVQLGESHLRVMSTLADLIAVAVQNVRSYRQAQELAALEERTRLARELHDSVSQALYGIGLGAQTARAMLDKDPALVRQPLDYVLSLAQAGLTEMRALIFELRPETLENEGLITALAKQGASLQARHNIQVQLELCDEPSLSLPDKESLYRIAREALHNVIKHAQATRVVLRMAQDGDMLALEVIDNGRGFDTGRDFPGHLGLQSMRERVINLGGSLEIYSTPGSGARISARLPVH